MSQGWWRCWINEDGKVDWIRENERAPFGVKWKSAHLFSEPLSSVNVERVFVRGPITFFACIDRQASAYQKKELKQQLSNRLYDFLVKWNILPTCLRYYETDFGFEVEVLEEVFLPNIKNIKRLEVDAYWVCKNSFFYEQDCKVEFPQYVRVEAFKREVAGVALLFTLYGRHEISLEEFWEENSGLNFSSQRYLTELHYSYLIEQEEFFVKTPSFLFDCSLLRTGVTKWDELSLNEREVLKSVFGNRLKKFLSREQMQEWPEGEAKNTRFSSRIERLFALFSCTTCEQLSGLKGRVKCDRNCKCRFNSPRALQFKKISYNKRKREFVSPYPFVQTKGRWDFIDSPIWVYTCFESEEGETLGYELFFIASDGQFKTLIVTVEEFSTPVLFASLINFGMRLPKSKTLRGELRCYLRYQEPMQTEIQVSEGGWQYDNTFGLLGRGSRRGFLRSVSPSAALENISWQWRDSVGRGKDIENGLEAFIKIVAATAPVLKKLNLSGVGIHFYGGNQGERDEIARVASTLWNYSYGECGYSIHDASSNVQELKRVYQDQPICVVNISPDNIKKYRSFLKRFLMGRKGVDSSTCGCIISVGSDNIATRVSQQRNRMYYEQDGKILALCFDISLFDELKWRQRVDFQVEEVLQRVFELKDVERRLKFIDRDFLFGEKNRLPKAVKKRFCAFALTSTDVFSQGNGSRFLNLIETIALKWESQVNDGWEYLYENLPRLLRVVRSYGIQHNRRRYLFFPSKGYKGVLGLDQGELASFSQYLLSKKVLIPGPEGSATQVRYVQELGKSLRGYLLKKSIFRT